MYFFWFSGFALLVWSSVLLWLCPSVCGPSLSSCLWRDGVTVHRWQQKLWSSSSTILVWATCLGERITSTTRGSRVEFWRWKKTGFLAFDTLPTHSFPVRTQLLPLLPLLLLHLFLTNYLLALLLWVLITTHLKK